MAFIYDLTDTWNAGGTTFNAIKMNVTDTASAAASKLVTLQVGGSERFSIDKAGIGTFASVIRAAGGSVSAPTFSFSSDTNTGMWSPSSDAIAFSTAGSERVRVTSTGNVGIGTTSPAQKLNVIGDIQLSRSTTASDAAINFGSNNSNYIYGGNSSNLMAFQVNASERMRITAAGDVGIGTSSPSAKVEAAGTGVIYSLKYTNDAGNALIAWKNTSGTTLWDIGGGVVAAQDELAFRRQGSAVMLLNSSGNVGIGTSSPGVKLDVNAGALGGTAGNTLSLSRFYGQTGSNQRNLTASLIRNSNGSDWTTTTVRLQNVIDATNSAYVDFSPNGTNDLAFGTGSSAAERMRINSSGNVGVGITSPSAKLDVAGNIFSRPGGAAGAIAELTADASSGANGISLIAGFASGGYGPIKLLTSATERMRIDSSGQVGIGTTSLSAGYGSGKSLMLTNQSSVLFQNSSNAWNSTTAGGAVTYFSDNNLYIDAKDSTSNIIFRVNGTNDRMRINSSGNLLVGTTSYAGGSATGQTMVSSGTIYQNGGTAGINFVEDKPSGYSETAYHIFRVNFTTVGSITTTGSATAYNTSSDYRLKDIDGPIANSGAYIDALKPVQGSWKADGSRFIGLLAHEVQEVSETQIATGEKDGDEMQAMDYSSPEIIANLIAEIQSLRARVAQLEGN